MNQNYMKITIPSKPCNELIARKAVASFVEQLEPSREELNELMAAVSEAVSNSVQHAYPNKIGVIGISCNILKDGMLSIAIKDSGVGISDIKQARTPLFTTGNEWNSGMGFTIMSSLCDDIEVTSLPNKGTTVTLKKRISKPKKQNKRG